MVAALPELSMLLNYVVFPQASNEPDVYETSDLPEDDQAQFESVSENNKPGFSNLSTTSLLLPTLSLYRTLGLTCRAERMLPSFLTSW